MQKKHILMICCALLALVMIFVAVSAALLMGGDSYADLIKAGNRYLEMGDYENAILMYNKARAQDQDAEAAYHGLYLAYMGAGQTDNAQAALNTGIEFSGSDELQSLLDALGNISDSEDEEVTPPEDTTPEQDNDDEQTLSLNIPLMECVAFSNYGDYMLRYGYTRGELNSGVYSVHISGLKATLYFTLTEGEEPADTQTPDRVVLDQATQMFYDNEVTFAQLKEMDGVSNAKENGDKITFKYKTCKVTVACDGNKTITAGSANTLVPEKQQVVPTTRVLGVTVLDKNTDRAIAGAKVEVFDAESGDSVGKENTDDSGAVTFTVPKKGNYTVKISKTGYNTESFDVQVMGGSERTDVELELTPVTMRLHVTVKNKATGDTIKGARVRVYKKGDVNGTLIGEDDTNSSGVAKITVPVAGKYVAVVEKSGYHSKNGDATVENGVEKTKLTVKLEPDVPETTPPPTTTTPPTETAPPPSEAPAVPCALKLTITNATNNEIVSGASVLLAATNGAPMDEGVADANGNLTLTAPDSGRYELTVSKDGFITAGFDITVEDGQTELTKTLQISPEMRSGEIRLVLTWDENPRDIDSHLVGTSSGGRNVNVMWQNKRSYDENGNVIAELDVDDTTSFGPETTTIHDVGGSYEYYIHKFAGDGTVGSSGAVVKIYVDNALYATVEVPTDITGDWQVCTINNGRVSVTNCAR